MYKHEMFETISSTKTPTIIDIPNISTVPAPTPASSPESNNVDYWYPSTMRDDVSSSSTMGMLSFSFFILFGIFWVVAGIVAFVMSIVCFGRSPRVLENVFGFLLAFFFGPFYWIYYFMSKSYCAIDNATSVVSGGKKTCK
jgi:hypothetical protein